MGPLPLCLLLALGRRLVLTGVRAVRTRARACGVLRTPAHPCLASPLRPGPVQPLRGADTQLLSSVRGARREHPRGTSQGAAQRSQCLGLNLIFPQAEALGHRQTWGKVGEKFMHILSGLKRH